jgi:exodeoxyribonuclease V alpha subunit
MNCELRPIDRQFADFICRQSDSDTRLLWSAAALVSNAVGQGHICLDLAEAAGTEVLVEGQSFMLPATDHIVAALNDARAVGAPGQYRPLVLDAAGRLYLHRYWNYEYDLAQILLAKAASVEPLCEDTLREGLSRLFPSSAEEATDWQAVAAIAALRKKFCIISGGPGSGKTSTVVKILALMIEQQPAGHLRIALAAPTGKAAARLKESISRMKESLPCADEVKQKIPAEVSTIHRLLGSISGSVRFRYSAENRMPYDVVIIDEASMVDLPLMAKLVTALKDDVRLILLGDRDQLASVEAGAVLGDLCGGSAQESFSTHFCGQVERLSGEVLQNAANEPSPALTDCLVILKKNYRFQSNSGIGMLAAAVNAGEGSQAAALLADSRSADVSWADVPEPAALKRSLAAEILEGYRHYLDAPTVEEALARFDSFRILCALREGPYGVAGITRLVEDILAENRLIDLNSRWYKGRPVIITVNDYSMKLFNGDVGIVFPDPDLSGMPRVCFPTADGGVRKVSPVRLPAHETVYAMTVHKSQGSEFDRVLMLLPNHDSAALSRELLYTGITRAKHAVRIWGNSEVFAEAAARRIHRRSGLADALWMTAK